MKLYAFAITTFGGQINLLKTQFLDLGVLNFQLKLTVTKNPFVLVRLTHFNQHSHIPNYFTFHMIS